MEEYYTDKNFIKGLYKLMYNVHNIFVKNGIFYYVEAGTLLGAVRNFGVIPWDDDVDLQIDSEDLAKVLSPKVKKELDRAGYRIKDSRKSQGWIKIAKKGTGQQPGADIFPVFIGKKGGRYRTFWDFQIGDDEWPKCYFYLNELLPLKEYKFGEIFVLGPKNPIPYLDRCFGRTWSKKGYITQDKDHMTLDEPILIKKGDFKAGRDFYVPPKSKPQITLSKGDPYLDAQTTSWGRGPWGKTKRRRTPRRSPRRRKTTVAQKRAECRARGEVYDTGTKRCRASKRPGERPKKRTPRRSPPRRKTTVAQKRADCRARGEVYDTGTKRCRASKRPGEKPRRRSPRRRSRARKSCPRGQVRSPTGRCIKKGGAAYKKHFG